MQDSTSKAEFNIKKMSCISCVNKIKSALAIEGIKSVEINLQKELATIIYDKKKISLDKIKSKIISLGYCVCNSNPCICNNNLSNASSSFNQNSLLSGLIYGLIPHTFCIAFILASILGVSLAVEFFKPFLLSPYFFYILIVLSIAIATFSALIYLKSVGLLSIEGIKKKWKYLFTLYGSTLTINLILFLFIFPIVTNFATASTSDSALLSFSNSNISTNISSSNNSQNNFQLIKLSVDIPCSGHSPLISSELKKLNGVKAVKYDFPNYFTISFDPSKVTQQQILSLDVFKTYKASLVQNLDSNFSQQNSQLQNSNFQSFTNNSNAQAKGCSLSLGGCSCGCGYRK
ncbi:MAG: cation transporter [Candidatus Micrarchaeota archaeon]|nr:cation transporter [Candidatus Micrarchaeota archaeon]